jgi:hypothetical protein
MMKQLRWLLPVILLAGCGGVEDPVGVSEAECKGAKPFWAITSGSAMPIGMCEGEYAGYYRMLLQATGIATHLGKATWTASHCLDIATFQGTAGSGKWVAANGDELHITYPPMELTFTSPTDFNYKMTETVSGGTGRFTKATGKIVDTGSMSVLAMPMVWTDEPSIGYIKY